MSAWELRLGDCLDPVTGLASLADKSVDHVICDPPYSEYTHAKVRRGGSMHATDKRASISTSVVLGFDALAEDVRIAVAAQIARAVKRWIVIFSDAESVHRWGSALTDVDVEHVRTGAWMKLGATPQFTGDRPGIGYESIEIAHPPGRKRWNGGGRHGVWSFAIASDNRVHTTQKPEALMEALVRDFTGPGDLICDPFAGSGTTGVAAIRLGRRFIGWERDEKYHRIATQRLSLTREQLDLPIAPPRTRQKAAQAALALGGRGGGERR